MLDFLEMEETVGRAWHRLVGGAASYPINPDHAVSLAEMAFAGGLGAPLIGRHVQAAEAAQEAGLGVNAGHDLNLDNLPAFVQAIPQLAEVSIGHAITADALRIGFPAAVEAYLRALRRISHPPD